MEKEYIYWDMACPHCSHAFTVKATIVPGFSDHEEVNCPACGQLVRTIRADMGYEIIKK